MPEIIEAQLLADGLQSSVGRSIVKVEKLDQNNILNKEEELIEWVEGSRITEVFRVGKRPCLTLDKDGETRIVDVFLSMAGAFMVNKKTKVARVAVHLDNGDIIYYLDGRKWGRFTLRTPAQFEKKFSTKAVDTMKADSVEIGMRLVEVQGQKKHADKSMKSILMNQGILVGLGNVYAQEALHLANIHPETKLKMLSTNHLDRLAQHIKVMLNRSYEIGGLSLKDYVHVDGSLGSAFDEVNVYQQKSCRTCGNQVEKIKQGSRSTYYCPKCQPKDLSGLAIPL